MSKLLALIDGSVYARSVCDHAAWIAGRTDSSIELLHILGRRETGSPPADRSGSLFFGARTALLKELSEHDAERSKLAQKRGRALLDGARQILQAAGIADITERLRFGDLVDAVVETESDASMVVIGKRGEAADFARLHLGSNLERVVRASQRPLFVAARAFQPITSMLIAFDGGTSSLKAVAEIAGNRLFNGLSCRLLMVAPDKDAARRQIDAAAHRLQAAGHTVEAILRQGHAEAEITRAVDDHHIGLLVMGAYGHSRVRNLIIGSTTEHMLRACKIPVLLYR
ncbi:MAG: universal stress protein [Alphaproteobacteria bacterium]